MRNDAFENAFNDLWKRYTSLLSDRSDRPGVATFEQSMQVQLEVASFAAEYLRHDVLSIFVATLLENCIRVAGRFASSDKASGQHHEQLARQFAFSGVHSLRRALP